jgi:YVTN family beta-propeller protein
MTNHLSRLLSLATACVVFCGTALHSQSAIDAGLPSATVPHDVQDGADLPNGWKIRPAGKPIGEFGDLVVNVTPSPDGRIVVAAHAGFLPHGIEVFDTATRQQIQHISLPSVWQGMEWSPDGKTLYVAGGNATGLFNKKTPVAPVYAFSYADGRLSDFPISQLVETIAPSEVWWSGLAYQKRGNLLYAVNRGTGTGPGGVVVFDTKSGAIVTRIPVQITPYGAVLSADGKHLFVSNWSSASVSVIDTESNTVQATLQVGLNPTDMKLSRDGRLFVACANDNTVHVIDTRTLKAVETISTTQTPHAPEGSTPNALAIDDTRKLLYVANADNNSLAVARIDSSAHTTVIGFIPTGWYPSALALVDKGNTLYIGNTKGEGMHADPNGPHSPFAPKSNDVHTSVSIKTLQRSSLEVLDVRDIKAKLPEWTKTVAANTPYKDSFLSEARKPDAPSVLPQKVGAGSPIDHIIYIIKENRTFDQEFGDLPKANGDPRLTIFGETVTPNQHALAKQYVIFDNLYCDGEVSVDGHSWSNSAYATDFNEKQWPPLYGGFSLASYDVQAMVPSAGHLWDLAAKKGLTYRSYAENASRASVGTPMAAAPGSEGLRGHVSEAFINGLGVRDSVKVKVFLKEFAEYEKNFDSTDPNKRLPNYIVMSMGEDHTLGTRVGANTPVAMVADNDFAIGELVEAVSHSKYWPKTAIFIIEDDGQDGSDHVDARRTVGLVISPYVKRGIIDSTLYSTSSMVRSMELLLGLPPMSQYDAAAMPMYNAFGTVAQVTPFNVIQPMVDVDAKNTKASPGAKQSGKMNFKDFDRAPMKALNEVIWKSVKGADATMPPPVHRFRPLVDAGDKLKDDDDRD